MAQTTDTSSDSDQIQIINRVGMILYAQVAGETRAEGRIIDNQIKTFMLSGPISATSIVENTGNVDLEGKYFLKVKTLFTDRIIYTNEEAPIEKVVLPGTKRFVTSRWENSPNFGIYKVEQTIDFASDSDTLEKIVLICPLWLIIIIILFIAAVIFHFVYHHQEKKGANSKEDR